MEISKEEWDKKYGGIPDTKKFTFDDYLWMYTIGIAIIFSLLYVPCMKCGS